MTEFDLHQNRDCGQLWLDDRKMLWETVRSLKPRLAAETGTWRGGGSTFFIASAMKMNGTGVLHTVECDPSAHREASHRYLRGDWSHLAPHVRLHLGDSIEVYRDVLANETLDMVFLDGSDEAMLPEYRLLAPKLRIGGVLFCHDWHNGKCEELKPVLGFAALQGGKVFDHPDWQIEIIGDGNGTFERGSVGLLRAVKLR